MFWDDHGGVRMMQLCIWQKIMRDVCGHKKHARRQNTARPARPEDGQTVYSEGEGVLHMTRNRHASSAGCSLMRLALVPRPAMDPTAVSSGGGFLVRHTRSATSDGCTHGPVVRLNGTNKQY